VQELRGEKIDIIEYNPDPARYVVNALAPAVISKVVIDQTNRLMEVIVPDDQLSLAIGKRGQNVRLASKLAEWRIDVKSEAKYQKSLKDGYDSLLALPGVGDSTADNLYEAGFAAAEDLAGAQVEELVALPGLSQQKAVKFIEAAKVYEGERKVREAAAKEEEAVAREKEAAAKKEEAAAKKEEAAAKEEEAAAKEKEAAAKEEEAALKEGYDSLLALPGVGGSTADNLSEAGFASAEDLAGAQVEELVALPALSQQKAVKFIEAAKSYAAEQKEKEAAAKDEEAGEPEETTAE
ncbi:MAG: helix-hairpin-helix domain-containing protein, partial [Syntrophobacteria bacterium]